MQSPFRPYQGDEPFVFICYAHDDDEVVYPELVRLREQGINVWYDEGISPGAEWTEVLADRIKNCSCFLYYISPGSIASEHCRQELLFAQGESCEILAVHLEQTDLRGYSTPWREHLPSLALVGVGPASPRERPSQPLLPRVPTRTAHLSLPSG